MVTFEGIPGYKVTDECPEIKPGTQFVAVWIYRFRVFSDLIYLVKE